MTLFGDPGTHASTKVVGLLLDVMFFGLAIVTVFSLWVNGVIWLINFMIIRHQTNSLLITKDEKTRLNILVQEAFAPLIGILHAFITTNEGTYIYPVLFLKNKFRLFKPIGTQSTQPVVLPHYIPYRFHTVTLQYIDLLRMTALPVKVKVDVSFHNYPPDHKLAEKVIPPLIHREDNEALVIPRKKEGDYLHYKHFETGDDVRRIVWKIYAKNKDLIVRVPEQEYETANTCYMSYNMVQEHPVKGDYNDIALDYFKWSVWNIYQTLRKRNNLLLKTATGNSTLLPETTIVKNYLTGLHWQPSGTRHNIDTRQDNIICIHSAMTLSEINRIITRLYPSQTVYFIPLSQAFQVNLVSRGIRKLFFINLHPDPVVQTKIRFQFSGTRKKWRKKESEIVALLQEHKIRHEILPAIE